LGTDTSSVVRILPFGNMFDRPNPAGGSMLSNDELEAPDADAAEQNQDAIPAVDDADELDPLTELPLEANQADSAEQARELDLDDDEYR
jgi:hypothetical protein